MQVDYEGDRARRSFVLGKRGFFFPPVGARNVVDEQRLVDHFFFQLGLVPVYFFFSFSFFFPRAEGEKARRRWHRQADEALIVVVVNEEEEALR